MLHYISAEDVKLNVVSFHMRWLLKLVCNFTPSQRMLELISYVDTGTCIVPGLSLEVTELTNEPCRRIF
jgi:hypothetical protein